MAPTESLSAAQQEHIERAKECAERERLTEVAFRKVRGNMVLLAFVDLLVATMLYAMGLTATTFILSIMFLVDAFHQLWISWLLTEWLHIDGQERVSRLKPLASLAQRTFLLHVVSNGAYLAHLLVIHAAMKGLPLLALALIAPRIAKMWSLYCFSKAMESAVETPLLDHKDRYETLREHWPEDTLRKRIVKQCMCAILLITFLVKGATIAEHVFVDLETRIVDGVVYGSGNNTFMMKGLYYSPMLMAETDDCKQAITTATVAGCEVSAGDPLGCAGGFMFGLVFGC